MQSVVATRKDDRLNGGRTGVYNQTDAMPQPANPLLALNGTLWDKALQQLFGPMVSSGLFGARRSPRTCSDSFLPQLKALVIPKAKLAVRCSWLGMIRV